MGHLLSGEHLLETPTRNEEPGSDPERRDLAAAHALVGGLPRNSQDARGLFDGQDFRR
jgi:hypothetical protein